MLLTTYRGFGKFLANKIFLLVTVVMFPLAIAEAKHVGAEFLVTLLMAGLSSVPFLIVNLYFTFREKNKTEFNKMISEQYAQIMTHYDLF